MAKIAVELQKALKRRVVSGAPGHASACRIAQGAGWAVSNVVCTLGPQDRSFEELHSSFSLAIVTAGSFQYRASSKYNAATTGELMTPGSLLLGNPGQSFECGHEHGAGDCCLSFHFAPDYFERIAADAGASSNEMDFRLLRMPPLQALSPLIARACAGLAENLNAPWEEIGIQLAARTIQLAHGISSNQRHAAPSAVARVTQALRRIEQHPNADLSVVRLAREAGLTPYHFLRTFQQLTGVTPHQYILRARLREAAMRLVAESAKVLDIALDCGFGDVSNFNRAFRGEFGMNPRAYRQQRTSSR